MKISEWLDNNGFKFSEKGWEVLRKAINDLYPEFTNRIGLIYYYDWTDQQLLEIVQRTAKYAKLWIFS